MERYFPINMKPYDHKKIERKWQKEWTKKKLYKTSADTKKPKCYVLDMFPYPSGEGLHVGHPKGYIATDVYSRWKRMNGFNILHPMGWDAFGLPAENFAIKHKVHPSIAVKRNIKRYKEQLSVIGSNYDWDREINTTDPAYYTWTQWIFLKLYEKGLAYESYEPINWCPSCKTGLANEDLEGGKCERCGSAVEKRPMRQWVLRITKYADRMLADLENLNWPESIKESQRNWIGRSEGAEIDFKLAGVSGQDDGKHAVKVFTTRPDTLLGATFVAVSAELAQKWVDVGWKTSDEVKTYIEKTAKENLSRSFEEKEKTGIFSGIYAVNPANQEKIPVWVVNYVLGDVGTGAIMAVPAHDERDFEFAKKYNLPIKQVIEPLFIDTKEPSAYRASEPIVERNGIAAIVKHWKEDTYMCLAWKKVVWHTWITGGIERGQTPEAAALMEIKEETGFTDAIFKKNLGRFHSLFYHNPKGENRLLHADVLYFELQSNEQAKISDEEKTKHDIHWYSLTELANILTAESHRYVLKLFIEQLPVYTGAGILVASGTFDGMASKDAKDAITKFVGGKKTVTYKIKDWVFSRQRYWGEPIPMIHCAKCGVVPVPEKDLPVKLPAVKSYEPSGTGESPLANISKWLNVKCPKCKSPAKRETNTMPQWAGSSWYYLRYIDPKNKKALVDKKKEKYWSPVDMYVGGAEHATRHLIYARFWYKFLYDIGTVNYEEPFMRLQNVGLIHAEDGRKMSKRYGNVVNPDDVVATYGADTLRLYEMFMGPFAQSVSWCPESIIGPRRFLERVWRVAGELSTNDNASLESLIHKTIKKVTEDIESFGFNTAISALMILLNAMEKGKPSKKQFELFLAILAPFAPHITEELWQILGHKRSIHLETWPSWDERKIKEEEITIVVQVNGKVRASFTAAPGIGEEEAQNRASALPEVQKWTKGKEVIKAIYIKNKIVSLVVKE